MGERERMTVARAGARGGRGGGQGGGGGGWRRGRRLLWKYQKQKELKDVTKER